MTAGHEAAALGGEHAELVARLARGERAALARVLTLLERDPALLAPLDAAIAPLCGRAYTVGITGAPGAGKSTLVGTMLEDALARDQRTAVLALDPVSPVSEGAILGDRMRMEAVAGDERLFVRSLGARRARGGLSLVAPFAVRAIDAAGWPTILVETVGVGQSELDIVDAACTTVVVLTPGMGDEVQAIKAGLMEVADVFVVNKADREGAAQVCRDVERLVSAATDGWRAPVLATVALERQGSDQLWEAVAAHREHLERTGEIAARRLRLPGLALRALVEDELRGRLEAVSAGAGWSRTLTAIVAGEDSIGAAARRVLDAIRSASDLP